MAQQADSTSVGITWYFTLSVGVSAACLYLLVFDVARLRCPGPAKLPCFHGSETQARSVTSARTSVPGLDGH